MKMMVYMVKYIGGWEDENYIVGIASSYEKAQEMIKIDMCERKEEEDEVYYDEYDIYKYQVDEGV